MRMVPASAGESATARVSKARVSGVLRAAVVARTLIGGVVLALQACSTVPGSVLRVEEDDSARPIELKTGQLLEVRLIHPGQGLTIALGSVVTPTLVLAGKPTLHDDTVRGGVSGTGNFESWVFRAAQPGTATLRMDYRMQWATTGPPTRSVTYNVAVVP
jgi:predicted secreted protein